MPGVPHCRANTDMCPRAPPLGIDGGVPFFWAPAVSPREGVQWASGAALCCPFCWRMPKKTRLKELRPLFHFLFPCREGDPHCQQSPGCTLTTESPL